MEKSETATPDANWSQTFDALGMDPEANAEPAGESPTEPVEASPVTADTDAGAGPEGSAEEAVEGQLDAPEAAAAPDKAGQPAPVAPELTPFVPRVDGRDLMIPGALQTDTHIVIPKESWSRVVQNHLGDRQAWRAKEQDYKQQIQAKGEKEAQAEVVLNHFAGLLEQGEAAVLEWFRHFDQNRAVLAKDIELAAARAQLDTRKKQDDEKATDQQLRDYEAFRPRAIDAALTAILARAEFKDSGLDKAWLAKALARQGDALFFLADEQTPAEWGLRPGQFGIYADKVYEEVQDRAEFLKQARAGQQEVAAAKKANAAATGKTPSKAPPAVGSKGAPVPGGKQQNKPTTLEEFEEKFASLKL